MVAYRHLMSNDRKLVHLQAGLISAIYGLVSNEPSCADHVRCHPTRIQLRNTEGCDGRATYPS